MIVVFDASSIVGAAFKEDSTPMRALLAAWSHDVIALSDAVFDEIAEVLSSTLSKIAPCHRPGRM
ncbi:MAG: hypothetical protein ABSC95_22705 [Acetobacteraceae bacterium]